LERLVENSFQAIDQGSYDLKRSTTHDTLSLKKAISLCKHAPLITEVKFSSPSRGQIRAVGTPAEIGLAMEESGATALSVLTQPFLFDGSLGNMLAVRKAVSLPLLMKDIIVSEVQIDAAKQVGADCILLIKAVFDRGLAEASIEKLDEYARKKGLNVFVEAHSEQEYADCISSNYELIGINNRNLSDLSIDLANTERLIKKVGKGKSSVIISESGISKPADIQYLHKVGADAFLVGTSIMETDDVGSKVKELFYAL
jgi:indole-3-glycerol phosphate synthase